MTSSGFSIGSTPGAERDWIRRNTNVVDNNLVSYLNDHLAGSAGARELLDSHGGEAKGTRADGFGIKLNSTEFTRGSVQFTSAPQGSRAKSFASYTSRMP